MVSCVFSYPLKLQISVSFNKWFYYASVTYLLYLVVNILIAEKFLWMKSFILLKSKFESVPLIFCQASLWPLPHISPPSHLFLIASSCRASFPPSCHPCELLPQSYVASQPPSRTVPLSAIPPLSLPQRSFLPLHPLCHFSTCPFLIPGSSSMTWVQSGQYQSISTCLLCFDGHMGSKHFLRSFFVHFSREISTHEQQLKWGLFFLFFFFPAVWVFVHPGNVKIRSACWSKGFVQPLETSSSGWSMPKSALPNALMCHRLSQRPPLLCKGFR